MCCPFETGLVNKAIIPNGGDRRERKAFSDTTFFRLLSSGGDQPVELRQRLCLSSVLYYNTTTRVAQGYFFFYFLT